jgi:hypothetical protein
VRSTLDLPVGAAQHLVGLLDTLQGLPSTPEPVAESAASLIGRLNERLPDPHYPQPWHREREHQDWVTLDEPTITAIAELLELFSTMPSTPPALAEDAGHQAELLWRELGA